MVRKQREKLHLIEIENLWKGPELTLQGVPKKLGVTASIASSNSQLETLGWKDTTLPLSRPPDCAESLDNSTTNSLLPIFNYQLSYQLSIAYCPLQIANCQLQFTKWPKNISISSQFS